ncbi:MAG: gliding motility lipoprotein GldH [Bacteroidales bacterium]
MIMTIAKTKNHNRVACFFALLLMFILSSCSSNVIHDFYVPIPNKTWHKDSIVSFYISIEDTITSTNTIYINLRNTSAYPYCNIFLFVTTYLPSGVSVRDTVEYMLADQYGKWYGKGFSYLLDNRLVYQQNVQFPHSGIYRFDIQQGMRNELLQHISDIGLRIEK